MTLKAKGTIGVVGSRVICATGGFMLVLLTIAVPGTARLGVAFPLLAFVYNATTPLQLTMTRPGLLRVESALGDRTVDLKSGFALQETRLGKQYLRLSIEGRRLRLNRFGTLDEVDTWLKEAQVAV